MKKNVHYIWNMCQWLFLFITKLHFSSKIAFCIMKWNTLSLSFFAIPHDFLKQRVSVESSHNSKNNWKIHSFSLQHKRHTNIIFSSLNNEVKEVNSFNLLSIEKYFSGSFTSQQTGKFYSVELKLLWAQGFQTFSFLYLKS